MCIIAMIIHTFYMYMYMHTVHMYWPRGYYDDHACTVVFTQLTKKAGSWIPRLERMVQSRGLCPFEKQVLLTLIGFVIQPNKVSEYVQYTCTSCTCMYMYVYGGSITSEYLCACF